MRWGLLLLLACAPRQVMVPHLCAPTSDSIAFQKCAADCPDGEAVIWENASNTHCICRKPRDGT